MKKRYLGRQFEKNLDIYNEKINFKQLLVISETGEQLGFLKREEALRIAFEKNLDLVLVSNNEKNPVAKIINYNKFKFERKKKQEEKSKNNKVIELKEIRMSSTIEKNDMNFKIKNAIKFLQKGNKLKVSLMFKGRKITNKEQGFKIMEDFLNELKPYSKVLKEPKLNGRFYNAYLEPLKNKNQGVKEKNA